MYFPLVGERVWVSGCRDKFIVQHTDYTAHVAAIALASDAEPLGTSKVSLLDAPFHLLLAHSEFEESQGGGNGPVEVREVLRSSAVCIRHSYAAIRELREATRIALDSVRQSQALIAQSNHLIALWQTLGRDDGSNGREESK